MQDAELSDRYSVPVAVPSISGPHSRCSNGPDSSLNWYTHGPATWMRSGAIRTVIFFALVISITLAPPPQSSARPFWVLLTSLSVPAPFVTTLNSCSSQ